VAGGNDKKGLLFFNQNMKVVIDTNILIDAMADNFSYTWKIVDLVLTGKIEAVASEKILKENLLIIERNITRESDREKLESFFNAVTVIPVYKRVMAVMDDPEDNKFVECALESGADYIISSDKHLLFLEQYKDVKILAPKDFWFKYSGENQSDADWQEVFKNMLGFGKK